MVLNFEFGKRDWLAVLLKNRNPPSNYLHLFAARIAKKWNENDDDGK